MTKLLSTLILTAAISLPAMAAPPVEGPATGDVKTGTTVITFADAIAEALDTADVVFKKAQPARINPGKGTLTYVASGGAIDLGNGRTEIINSGGITLAKEIVDPPITPSAPKAPKQYKTATILDPIVEYSSTPNPTPGEEPIVVQKISAIIVINGVSLGRVPVFNVEGTFFGSTPVLVPKNGKISFLDLSLKLTPEVAEALNEALGVPAFNSDTEVAKADITVKLAAGKL